MCRGLMLVVGFLTITSVVLGARNGRCQPKYGAVGWLPFSTFSSALIQ